MNYGQRTTNVTLLVWEWEGETPKHSLLNHMIETEKRSPPGAAISPISTVHVAERTSSSRTWKNYFCIILRFRPSDDIKVLFETLAAKKLSR